MTQKSAKIALSSSKYTKSQGRRVEDCALGEIGLNTPCVVGEVECRKVPVVKGFYKCL